MPENRNKLSLQQITINRKAKLPLSSNQKKVFVVNYGALKLSEVDDEGSEWVYSFYFPRELLELEPQHKKKNISASALIDTKVCAVDREVLIDFLSKEPRLINAFINKQSKALDHHYYLARKTVAKKLAGFLLEMIERLALKPGAILSLPMSRQEIADFLGIATETVIRTFLDFQRAGLISLKAKDVAFLDLQALEKVSKGEKH